MTSTNATSTTQANDADHWRDHLGWSAKQGRILTDSGNAMRYYSRENGYPFLPEELPHHHMERGDTHLAFHGWAEELRCSEGPGARTAERPPSVLASSNAATTRMLLSSPIVGAWGRTIFAGRWEHTSNKDEITYNVQTGTLFVDLRIPLSKPIGRWEKLERVVINDRRQALESLSDQELRLYARQHVFGGFTLLAMESKRPGRPVATRHHCVDWNHIPGKPRPRPNKWYIECENTAAPTNRWKEWSYSTDENGQCYYYEIWERMKGDEEGQGLRLAMRKRNGTTDAALSSTAACRDDGIFVVVGVSRRDVLIHFHVSFQISITLISMPYTVGSLQLCSGKTMERE
jgi:hypothetical protein